MPSGSYAERVVGIEWILADTKHDFWAHGSGSLLRARGNAGRLPSHYISYDQFHELCRDEDALTYRKIIDESREGTKDHWLYMIENTGATRQDRTGDLLITNQPLYQLS